LAAPGPDPGPGPIAAVNPPVLNHLRCGRYCHGDPAIGWTETANQSGQARLQQSFDSSSLHVIPWLSLSAVVERERLLLSSPRAVRARTHNRSDQSRSCAYISFAAACWVLDCARLPSRSFNSSSPIRPPAGQDHTMEQNYTVISITHSFVSVPGGHHERRGAGDRSDRDEGHPRWFGSCMAADRALHKPGVILINC
jgi:hypothetical protein